jgi:hypothetical protein
MARLDPALFPDEARQFLVTLADGTYAAGTVLGQITTGGKFTAYSNAASDGSQTARAILVYGCTVASGVITITDEWGRVEAAAPAYVAGTFNTADLTGLDAAAVAELGRLLSGDATAGLLRLG